MKINTSFDTEFFVLFYSKYKIQSYFIQHEYVIVELHVGGRETNHCARFPNCIAIIKQNQDKSMACYHLRWNLSGWIDGFLKNPKAILQVSNNVTAMENFDGFKYVYCQYIWGIYK